MQKVINVIALLSGLTSLALIGGGTYVYLQKDSIIDGVKEQVTKHATEAITGALPGMLDAAMPELPSATGPDVPGVPATGKTGPAIPF